MGRGPVAMRSRVASASSCSSMASVTSASACSSRGIHRSLVAQSRYRVASGSASTTRSAFAAAACRTAASRAAPCARRVPFTQAGGATRADGHSGRLPGATARRGGRPPSLSPGRRAQVPEPAVASLRARQSHRAMQEPPVPSLSPSGALPDQRVTLRNRVGQRVIRRIARRGQLGAGGQDGVTGGGIANGDHLDAPREGVTACGRIRGRGWV